jgi:hypothetical protein
VFSVRYVTHHILNIICKRLHKILKIHQHLKLLNKFVWSIKSMRLDQYPGNRLKTMEELHTTILVLSLMHKDNCMHKWIKFTSLILIFLAKLHIKSHKFSSQERKSVCFRHNFVKWG